jgi:hypothetical protein
MPLRPRRRSQRDRWLGLLRCHRAQAPVSDSHQETGDVGRGYGAAP